MNENPIQIIVDTISEYFNKNTDKLTYELSKGILSSKLGYGMTKTEKMCKVLANDYQFIENGRGKLIIDRRKFKMWAELRNEMIQQEITMDEIRANYPILIEELKQNREKVENAQKKMAEWQDENRSLETKHQKLTEKIAKLPDQKKALSEKFKAVEKEYQEKQQEIAKKVKAIEEKQRMMHNMAENEESGRNWLFRRPIMSNVVYDDSIAMRLFKGFGWFLGYSLVIYFILWVVDIVI